MGSALSILDQLYPPKPKWSTNDIPDLTGKVMIVTGGNAGIGKETVRVLLEHNAKVYLAARNQSRVEAAIQDLREKTGKEAIWLKLDLADLKSVKEAAAEFIEKENELHVLFNNAGICDLTKKLGLTAQGYDLEFGTNVLGHFYFTKLLLPILQSTAERNSDGNLKARVVNTSSSGHMYCKGLNFDSFRDSPDVRKKMFESNPMALYAQSKLGNVMFSKELAKRYSEHIISISLDPGPIETDIWEPNVSKFVMLIIRTLLLYPVELGALTQLWAGTSPEGTEMNGKYLRPWARLGNPSDVVQDTKQCEQLWEWLDEQVKDI